SLISLSVSRLGHLGIAGLPPSLTGPGSVRSLGLRFTMNRPSPVHRIDQARRRTLWRLRTENAAIREGHEMRRTGHIRERSPGSYELRCSLGTAPATGRRKIATTTFKGSLKEAQRELRRLQ